MGAALEYHVYVVTLGERIRDRREALGLSQEKLSRLVDVAKNTVGRWESNVDAPSGKNAQRLAKALQVTSDWVLGGEEAKTEPAPEVDEAARTALALALAHWDPGWGAPPTDEEREFLEGYHFRTEHERGVSIKPEHFVTRLREYRRDRSEKAAARQQAEMPKPRPGRVKLPKAKSKGR